MLELVDLDMTTNELLGEDITSELPMDIWANLTFASNDDPVRVSYRLLSVVGCRGNYIREGY